jgi:hypothetical protein
LHRRGLGGGMLHHRWKPGCAHFHPLPSNDSGQGTRRERSDAGGSSRAVARTARRAPAAHPEAAWRCRFPPHSTSWGRVYAAFGIVRLASLPIPPPAPFQPGGGLSHPAQPAGIAHQSQIPSGMNPINPQADAARQTIWSFDLGKASGAPSATAVRDNIGR